MVPKKASVQVDKTSVVSFADLCEYAAIIRIESSLVEEQTLLYCGISAIVLALPQQPLLSHTSLEARDGRRYLDACSEQIGQGGECYRQQDAEEGGGGEEERLGVVVVDLGDRIHRRAA